MAVWIDEDGMLVRPAEYATIQPARRDRAIPESLPERVRQVFEQVRAIPDSAEAYRAAIADWVANGAASRFALGPEEVVARSQPRGADEARAAACFEMGQHLWREHGNAAAIPWWREAHRLYPKNWTYKRQAWTFVTTPENAAEADLMQGPTEVYEGNWLDDVIAGGGGEAYYDPVQL